MAATKRRSDPAGSAIGATGGPASGPNSVTHAATVANAAERFSSNAVFFDRTGSTDPQPDGLQ